MIGNRRLRLVPARKGKFPQARGDSVTCKAVYEDPLGAYSLFEVTVAPQAGLPPLTHLWEEGAYYILSGRLLIQEGDRAYTATAGSFVNIPKGILHTFKNLGVSPARLLAIITPAWYGKFFEDWVSQPRPSSSSRLRLVHSTLSEFKIRDKKF